MAKKHGFRGTPVRPSPTPSSTGRIFERRGDPMVSPREGREKYGRNLETENPEFDQFFAGRAEDKTFERLASDLLKPSQVDKGNAFRSKIAKDNYDPQRAATSLVLSMKRKMRQEMPETIEYKPNSKVSLINCPYGPPHNSCTFTTHDSRKIKDHLRTTERRRDKNTGKIKCVPIGSKEGEEL